MAKRSGRRITKAIALVASLALVVGLMPAAAFAKAADGEGAGEATISSLQAAIVDGIQAADSQVTAQVVSAQDDKKIDKDQAEIIRKIITCAAVGIVSPEDAATMGIEFGAEMLCEKLFGFSEDEDQDALLRTILSNIEQLKTEIENLQKTVDSQQLDGVLKDLMQLTNDWTTNNVYDSLRLIDREDSLPAEKKAKRLGALTRDLGVTPDLWESVENPYDEFVRELWTAMTRTYSVTLSGKTRNLTLLQIQYEHLRYTCHWEHQAYDEWADYQARCVGLLISALTLEKASLQARIQLLNDWNSAHDPQDKRDTGAVISRVEEIQECINMALGYKGKDKDGNNVNYPGLFSKATWDSQYWMYKERPDVRYYWTPGNEILFYAKVNTQNVPQEKKGIGAYDKNAQGYSYWTSGYGKYRHTHHKVKFDFWKPFVRYQGGDSLLVSVDQLKKIYNDYKKDKNEKHLYSIFMSADEGNFQGLKVGNNKYWWFVVDPDSDHPLTYEDNGIWAADQVYCYVVKSANMNVETAVLAYYHDRSNEPNTNTHYIGIGVKRVGPETYDPNNLGKGGASPKAHTTTKLVKTFGDAPFSVAHKAKTGVKYAYSSSNKKVATVSSAGTVTIKRAGTAKITIKTTKTTKAGKTTTSYTMILKAKKAKNPIALDKKTATLKYSKLKKASKTVAINKAKKAKGKVTYAIAKAVKNKKSFKKNFAINAKTGKITVAKGTKRGTYKVTVKATAAGNANYKAGSKSAVITIRVR